MRSVCMGRGLSLRACLSGTVKSGPCTSATLQEPSRPCLPEASAAPFNHHRVLCCRVLTGSPFTSPHSSFLWTPGLALTPVSLCVWLGGPLLGPGLRAASEGVGVRC